jgi:hypothetical protein
MVKKSVNLLNDSDPATLAYDMELISNSRRERKRNAGFMNYLDFLESSAAAFGFTKRKRQREFTPESPDLLL